MVIDWSDEFDQWFARLEDQAEQGRDPLARTRYELLLAALAELQDLAGESDEEIKTLRRVRRSGRHQLWRVAHPYIEGIALRLICWFPPGGGSVVVAVVGADKGRMGDVFYDRLGDRADPIIDQWLRREERS